MLDDKQLEIELNRKNDKINEINNDELVNELHFNIGNSGFTFSVLNTETGPCLEITSGSFGHEMGHSRMYASAENIRRLGEMLIASSKFGDFNEVYCAPAEIDK